MRAAYEQLAIVAHRGADQRPAPIAGLERLFQRTFHRMFERGLGCSQNCGAAFHSDT